jgi:hypothetical protein
MDLDLDSYTPIVDAIEIQADVIDENSALGTLLPAQAATLAAANQANRDMLDAFLAASEFIRSETDDQSNDLLTIEPDQLADEAEIRVQIAALRSALDGPTTILNLGTVSLDEQLGIDFLNDSLGTEIDASGAILDLALFYEEHPFDLRGVLPTFDESNGVVADSFPDPTFRGVLTAPAPTSPLLSAASLITLGLLGRVRRAHRIRSAFMSHHH